MTAPTGAAGRLSALTSYDGSLARVLLGLWHHFATSAQFIAALVPAIVFTALVGWQPTHLAIVLGVLSLMPAGPGAYAVLAVNADRLAARGHVAGSGRRFWAAYAEGARRLAWWWAACGVLALVVGYDLALFGASDALLVGASVLAVAAAVTTIALAADARRGAADRPLAALAACGRTFARRPLAFFSWALLIVAVAATPLVPAVGASLFLFVPSLAAMAVLIVAADHPAAAARRTRARTAGGVA